MGDLLRRAVDSVLAQTYRDYELLLVDDGSIDESPAICDEYAAKYPFVRAIHKTNGGLSSARNVGMAEAKGEWITFCDADDYTLPCWLENFELKTADGYEMLTQGIICTRNIDGTGDVGRSYSTLYNGGRNDGIQSLFDAHIFGYMPIRAMRNEIIQKNNLKFNEKIKLRDDTEFLLRYCLYVKTMRITDKCGYYYFVPAWSNKYTLNLESSLAYYRSAFPAIKALGFAPNTMFRKEIREGYAIALNIAFGRAKSIVERFDIVKEISQILDEDYKESQIFKPTKFVLKYDKTHILAMAIYSVQHLIK